MPKMVKSELDDESFYAEFKRCTRRDIDNKIQSQIEGINEETWENSDEFKRRLIRFSDVLRQVQNVGVGEYIRAVYFCSLYAQGQTQVEAYRKVWPERAARKNQHNSTIGNSAFAYFNTLLVQSIWKQMNVADHMLFVEKRFKAYQMLEDVMDNEDINVRTRVDAATKLATLLKPPKEALMRIEVKQDSKEIKSLEDKLSQLADMQLRQLTMGRLSSQDIVEAEMIINEDDNE